MQQSKICHITCAVVAACYFQSAALSRSRGCDGTGATLSVGWQNISVQDFEQVPRRYWLVPAPTLVGSSGSEPAALLFSFHGQFGVAEDYASDHNFLAYIPKGCPLIIALPQGMADGVQGSGWNVGTGGDTSVCLPKGVDSACYTSCKRLGQCGRCNWSTCYDDRKFVAALLTSLSERFCLDLDRVYIQGESNGGMLVQYLTQEMPGAFAAAVSVYALPLLGYSSGADGQMARDIGLLRGTALLQLHGRQDDIIPVAGGVSSQGWIYIPSREVGAVWSGVHGCSRQPSDPMPWPNHFADGSMVCKEHAHCASGRRVATCLYDGVHGMWPQQYSGEALTMWFILQFSRNSTGQPDFSNSTGQPDFGKDLQDLPGFSRKFLVTLSLQWLIVLTISTCLCGALSGRACTFVRVCLRRRWQMRQANCGLKAGDPTVEMVGAPQTNDA